MTDQITMKQARKEYRRRRSTTTLSFRMWVRHQFFAHPVGKLAKIGGRHP